MFIAAIETSGPRGGVALADAVVKSGLSAWLGQETQLIAGLPLWLLVLVVAVVWLRLPGSCLRLVVLRRGALGPEGTGDARLLGSAGLADEPQRGGVLGHEAAFEGGLEDGLLQPRRGGFAMTVPLP